MCPSFEAPGFPEASPASLPGVNPRRWRWKARRHDTPTTSQSVQLLMFIDCLIDFLIFSLCFKLTMTFMNIWKSGRGNIYVIRLIVQMKQRVFFPVISFQGGGSICVSPRHFAQRVASAQEEWRSCAKPIRAQLSHWDLQYGWLGRGRGDQSAAQSYFIQLNQDGEVEARPRVKSRISRMNIYHTISLFVAKHVWLGACFIQKLPWHTDITNTVAISSIYRVICVHT